MTRDYYAQITSPDQAQSDSEHEEEPVANAPSSAPMAADMSNEVESGGPGEWENGEGGPSNVSGDEGSNPDGTTKRRRRGAVTKEGPTVYRLIKPVIRSIKEATATESAYFIHTWEEANP